jgi:hypothetical protein
LLCACERMLTACVIVPGSPALTVYLPTGVCVCALACVKFGVYHCLSVEDVRWVLCV